MNFFEQEMRFMLEDNDLLKDMKFSGKMMVGKLDDEKVYKAEFITTHTSNHYDAIKASVINKNGGVVDSHVFKFSDVVGMYYRGNGLDSIEPYMWVSDGNPSWYTPLSSSQKVQIGCAVLDYGEMYQDTQYALNMQFH